MRIQNNIMALNTHRQYTINTNSVAKSTEKLSSGYRVNRAGDDAAGLAISEKMRAQIKGLTMASKNSSDAISLIQTAEGALQESHNILQRMRELAVQSSSDTNETSIDRAALDAEFQQLIAELDDTARTARFNDMGVIDGSYASVIKTLTSSTSVPTGVTASIAGAMVGSHQITASHIEAVPGSSTAAVGPSESDTTVTGTTATVKFGCVDSVGASLNGSTANVDSITIESGTTNATMTLSINGKQYTATADMAATAAGEVIKFEFEGLGTLSYTTSGAIADYAAADTATDELRNVSIGFDKGKDEVIVPSQAAYVELTLTTGTSSNSEVVKVYAGESHAKFSNGLVLSFEKLGTLADNMGAFNSTATTDVSFTIEVDAKKGKPLVIQSGANQYDELRINIDRMDSELLGVKYSKISTRESASKAITEVNDALNKVSTQRAALGALENRLNYKINNLDTSAENLTAAEARIRDLDMAKEMTNYTKNNILMQASTAMLAQANSTPQNVLQLLQ